MYTFANCHDKCQSICNGLDRIINAKWIRSWLHALKSCGGFCCGGFMVYYHMMVSLAVCRGFTSAVVFFFYNTLV